MKNYLLDMYFEAVRRSDPLTVWDEAERAVVYAKDREEARLMAHKIMRALIDDDAILQYNSVVVTEL